MDCPRCHGLMQSYTLIDLEDETGKIAVNVLRCVNCGEVVDPVILENRKNSPAPMIGRARFTPKTAFTGTRG